MAIAAGIEALNVYGGAACLDVRELCVHRGLDMPRFDNLLMREKTVALPFEDPVTSPSTPPSRWWMPCCRNSGRASRWW